MIIKRTVSLFVFYVLLTANSLFGQASASRPPGSEFSRKPQNILFIGNSYTYFNDLDVVLKRMAWSADPPVKLNTARIVKGGATLERHFNAPQTLLRIQEVKWDVVILQEQSLRPVVDPNSFFDYARKINSEIKKTKAGTVFFMTWARQNKPNMIEPLSQAYTAIARELNEQAAPVGLAWDLSLKTRPDLILHTKDKSHPNRHGTYLAACVFYATLTAQSPVGLSDAGMKGITPDQALHFQKTAWLAVKAYRQKTKQKL